MRYSSYTQLHHSWKWDITHILHFIIPENEILFIYSISSSQEHKRPFTLQIIIPRKLDAAHILSEVMSLTFETAHILSTTHYRSWILLWDNAWLIPHHRIYNFRYCSYTSQNNYFIIRYCFYICSTSSSPERYINLICLASSSQKH
jgi:hypothetical protein